MFVRSAAGGAVCLRCRLQFLQRVRPIHAATSHTLLRRQQQSARCFATSGPEAPSFESHFELKDTSDQSTDTDRFAFGKKPKRTHRKYDDADPYRYSKPRTKKPLRAGRRVFTETTEDLGPEVLGKPAHAIVLRERDGRRKKRNLPQLDEDKAVATDLQSLLEGVQIQATKEEYRANITDLKPKGEKAIPERQFRKIQKALVDGFLVSQLKDYIVHNKIAQEYKGKRLTQDEQEGLEMEAIEGPLINERLEQEERKYDWVKDVSPWVPIGEDGVAYEPTAENFQPRIPGYMNDSMTAKEKLAVRILRGVWNITIEEMASQLGQVEVKLRNAEFILLMRGTKRFINQIGDNMLEPGEKIEMLRNRKTIRFTATRAKSDSIIQMLRKTINSVKAKAFPRTLISDTQIDDLILEEIGRITNTHVREATLPNNRLVVTWVDLVSRAGNVVEDLRHQVFRLLFTGFQHMPSSLYNLGPERDGYFIPDKINHEKWNWIHRMAGWERFVMPLKAIPDNVKRGGTTSVLDPTPLQNLPIQVESKQGSFLDPSVAIAADNTSTPSQQDASVPQRPMVWSQNLQKSTIAHFGHVLHRQSADPFADKHSAPKSDVTRIFSPVVPHPTQLVRLASEVEDAAPASAKSTILIRFWPSPSIKRDIPEGVIGGEYLDIANAVNVPPTQQERKKIESALKRNAKQLKLFRKDTSYTGKQKFKRGTVEDYQFSYFAPSAAPAIELRLSVTDDDQIVGVESLRAIVNTNISDVMMPKSLVDLRFTNTTFCELEAESLSPEMDQSHGDLLSTWEPVKSFLETARLDLANGRLEMPSGQKFPVPRRLFNDRDKTDGLGDLDELVSVSYEFVGLEIHRSAPFLHQGYRMSYKSVEAGKGGGRRAELGLEPVVLPVETNRPAAEEAAWQTPAEAPQSLVEEEVEDITSQIGTNDMSTQENLTEETTEQTSSSKQAADSTTIIETPAEAKEQKEDDKNSETVAPSPALTAEDKVKIRADFLARCYEFAANDDIWSRPYDLGKQRSED